MIKKLKYLISILVFLISISVNAEIHYVIDCKIFNHKMEQIKDFGGLYCIFNEDGSFIRSIGKYSPITLVSPYGNILWSRNMSAHHQLNLSLDGTKLLVLDQEEKELEWCRPRVDLIAILDFKTGKTLNQFSVLDHLPELFQKYTKFYVRKAAPDFFKKTNCQLTHFNSFYEIGDNELASKIPAFKKGNFLINDAIGGFYVFNKNLTKILWHVDLTEKFGEGFHDAQVTKNGKIIFFSNGGLKDAPQESLLCEYDPLTSTMVYLYPKKLLAPKKVIQFAGIKFEFEEKRRLEFSRYCGAIQLTADGILFSMNTEDRGGIASKATYGGDLIWQKAPLGISMETKMPANFQQIKQYDLSKFLQNNKL